MNAGDVAADVGFGSGRRGRERLRGLSTRESGLYRRILVGFGQGSPPTLRDLSDSASDEQLVVSALGRLRDEDLVHHDPMTGAILVAYPFSGRPTDHVVRLRGGHEVYAMCAVDALGIAPMLGEAIEVRSHDPLTGEDIRVALEPRGTGVWNPPDGVVLIGTSGSGELHRDCCPMLNFFASPATARRWLDERPAVRGSVISMEEAIVTGRAIFGDVLADH